MVSLSTTETKGENMRRIQLLLAAGAATVLAGLALNVPTAGAVTFHKHWKGNVVIDYAYGKDVFSNLQKDAKAKPPAVGTVFQDAWASHSTRTSVCTEIDRQLAAAPTANLTDFHQIESNSLGTRRPNRSMPGSLRILSQE